MDRRGLSHLEVVMAFLIFATAISFALYFFRPGSPRLVETSTDYIFREIENNVSSEVEIYGVKIETSAIPSGVSEISIEIPGVDSLKKARVANLQGERVLAKRFGDSVVVNSGGQNWDSDNFITVEFNEEFVEDDVGEVVHNSEYYVLSASSSRKVISEKKFRRLTTAYLENYEKIRGDFNIPRRVNFGIELIFSEDEKISAISNVFGAEEVFYDLKDFTVLRENGEIVNAQIGVRIW